MGFIFEAIFELLWILIYHFFNLGFVMISEIIKIIPFWLWIIILVVVLLYISLKLYLKYR